ncbi:LysE family translocator [Escherichia coli]|uniref:LysE family translocator n=1 Tax=Escherichia coli TaxID=562 RepID=A0A2X3KEG2_ECOLX|nr:LysE family translocator [Escherichia coli]
MVVQTSLASGRRAGVLTGLGVALGDAFYSGLGLFGLATLITQCEEIFSLIRIVGGAYLLWFAWWQHAPPVNTANEHTTTTD